MPSFIYSEKNLSPTPLLTNVGAWKNIALVTGSIISCIAPSVSATSYKYFQQPDINYNHTIDQTLSQEFIRPTSTLDSKMDNSKMTLTLTDLEAITKALEPQFDAIKKDINYIKKDIDDVKKDIGVLKNDVAGINQDYLKKSDVDSVFAIRENKELKSFKSLVITSAKWIVCSVIPAIIIFIYDRWELILKLLKPHNQ